MTRFLYILNKARQPRKEATIKRKVLYSFLILAFGICLGLFSKMLDEMAFNELPLLFQKLDITNFLGRFAVWIFIATCISIYSFSAKRAALNTFLFFGGMVGSYYFYSAFVAGFFPKTYAMIWFGITALSPILAYFCWYAKGEGWIGIVFSGVIIGVMFSQAVFLFQGIRITYVPEVILWLASFFILRRKPKEFAIECGISVITVVILQSALPFF